MNKKTPLFSITKKDLEIQTFKGSGPGGQHRNKTESGIRIIHRESGAVGESSSEKSQHINKKLALKRLTENKKFKLWLNMRAFEVIKGQTIEQIVDIQKQFIL